MSVLSDRCGHSPPLRLVTANLQMVKNSQLMNNRRFKSVQLRDEKQRSCKIRVLLFGHSVRRLGHHTVTVGSGVRFSVCPPNKSVMHLLSIKWYRFISLSAIRSECGSSSVGGILIKCYTLVQFQPLGPDLMEVYLSWFRESVWYTEGRWFKSIYFHQKTCTAILNLRIELIIQRLLVRVQQSA